MVYVDRNQQMGGYTRQLAPSRIPRKVRVTLGADNLSESGAASWLDTTGDDVKVTFLAEFDFKLLPTHGQTIGARGALIEWDVPPPLKQASEWLIRDYDQVLIDKFVRWQRYSQELRLFINGLLWLRCRIREFNLMGPNKKDMRLHLTNRQLFIYSELHGCEVWVDDYRDNSYNNPFLVTHGYLYGDLTLPEVT